MNNEGVSHLEIGPSAEGESLVHRANGEMNIPMERFSNE